MGKTQADVKGTAIPRENGKNRQELVSQDGVLTLLFLGVVNKLVKTLMTEQQIDFLKIKQNIGKISPKQLGSLMKQYYERHLKDSVPPAKNYMEDVTALFGNTLDLSVSSDKMQG